MDDQQVHSIAQLVEQYRGTLGGQTLDIIKLQDFDALTVYVQNEGRFKSELEDSLRLVVALCWLGPLSAGIPPKALREDLWGILREDLPDPEVRRRRIVDVTLAYGCGKWRQIRDNAAGWDRRWQPALDCVAHYIGGWTKAVAAWLHFGINLKGYAFKASLPSSFDADELAQRIWLGKCDCWRLRYPQPDQALDHRAQRRQTRCFREHRLSAWNPLEISLSNFLARAVKGDKRKGDTRGRKSFIVGAIVQGMFFSDLCRHHGVRFGKVLLWRCPRHPQTLFEGFTGSRCLFCDAEGREMIFDESQHKREAKLRLFIPAPDGPYQETSYWHCQTCKNYYQENYETCPQCRERRKHGAAKSTVWVFASYISPIASREENFLSDTHNDLEEQIAWKQAFARLERHEQKALWMMKENFAPKEVAETLHIPLDKLDRLLKDAARKLRTLMEEES